MKTLSQAENTALNDLTKALFTMASIARMPAPSGLPGEGAPMTGEQKTSVLLLAAAMMIKESVGDKMLTRGQRYKIRNAAMVEFDKMLRKFT